MKTGKTTAFILALAVCCSSAVTGLTQTEKAQAYSSPYSDSVSETGQLGENISYELMNTGLLKIKGYGKTSDFEVSPFSSPEKISAVVFEPGENGGVEYLGNRIFASCSEMYGITLPDTLTEIGEYAFDECTSLREIIIPDSVKCIRKYAFHNCTGIRYAQLGEGLEKVGEGSAEFLIFNGCFGLEELSMPSLVTGKDNDQKVPEYTLGNGETIKIEINADTSINPELGQVCKFLETSSVFSDVLSSPSSLSEYNLNKITVRSGETIYPYAFAGLNVEHYILPDTLTKISDHSFYSNDALSEITIPVNVTEIGKYAFSECHVLSEITLWNNVKKFGDKAFSTSFATDPDVYFHGTKEEWRKLDTFWAFWGGEVHCLGNDSGNSSEVKHEHSGSEVIYTGSLGENIGYSFFKEGCLIINGSGRMNDFESCPFEFADEIKHISFDESSEVENIGQNAFSGCSSLEYADLSGSLTEIGNSAFFKCGSLKEITVPDSVKRVGESAFEECTGLTGAVLGEGLEYIGEGSVEFNIFRGCTSLGEITMPSLVTGYDEYTENDDGTKTRTSKYGQFRKLFDSESKIFKEGFALGSSPLYHLKKVIISSGTQIYPYAFCTGDFNEIILPDTVTKISENAFYACRVLKSIDISSTETIGNKAFEDCYSLENLTLGKCLSNIGKNAFAFAHPNRVFYNGTEEEWNSFISQYREKFFSDSAMRFTDPSKFIMTVGTNITSPSVLEAERGCGDVNGDGTTDLTDLTCLSMYLLRDYDLTVGGKVFSDITLDGSIDIADLAALKLIIMNEK